MGGHDEAAAFTQLVDHVLLHVEVLHEEEVRPIHLLGADADLVCLAEQAIAVLIGWDIILSFGPVRVDAHVVGDAVVVVTQGLIDAVDGLFFAFSTVGQTEKFARVAMEVVFLPLVGIHVLVRVVKVFALKRLRLLETVGGNGKVDIQHQQQQSNANASHHPAEIKPEAVFFLCFTHNELQRKGKKRDFVRFSI